MSEELLQTGADSADAGFVDTGSEAALNDVDAIAEAFLDGELGEVEEEAEADSAEQAEGTEDAESTEEAATEEAEALDIPMPEGMDAALWEQATPELRNAMHAREQAHAAALGKERQQYQELRVNREQFAIQANGQIQQALQIMKSVCEGEFAGINWQELSQQDPTTYVQLQQQYQQRMAAIQNIQHNVAMVTQAYQQRRLAEDHMAMQQEFATVEPEIRAMLGSSFEGKNFVGAVAQYMRKEGCPDAVIGGLTKGYELRIVAKAMLYDKLQAQRSAAQSKVADAPMVQTPRGKQQGREQNDTRLQRARAFLNKNPNSTDALAAVFETL